MSKPVSIEQNQRLLQTQRLLMTPQMRQALHLLQLPVMELSALIEQELERNPALEYEDSQLNPNDPLEKGIAEPPENEEMPLDTSLKFDDKDFEILRRLDDDFKDYIEDSVNIPRKRSSEEEQLKTFQEALIQENSSLFEHLMKQAQEYFESDEERRLAELLIGNFDSNGFLTTSLQEISLIENAESEKLQSVLEAIKSFDPPGVGASSIAESLLIQLAYHKKEQSLAYQMIQHHYDDLLHNRLPVIKKSLNCSLENIRSAILRDISKLDLRPGAVHNHTPVPYITADIAIRQEGEQLIVELNEDILPPIRINRQYFKLLDSEGLPQDSKDYIRQKISAGKWLLKSLHQRKETLFRITTVLAKKQRDYIIDPQGKLSPMTMKSVAEELDIHESTVARAVTDKYLACPRGLIPLRSFFTNAYHTNKGKNISSRTVKDLLLEILNNENKKQPLSDEELSQKIKEKGIECARRTVSKYRKELNVGTASQRKTY